MEDSGPVQACNGIALYFYLSGHINTQKKINIIKISKLLSFPLFAQLFLL